MVMSLSAEQARRQSCSPAAAMAAAAPCWPGSAAAGLAAAEGEVAMAGGKAVEVVRTRLGRRPHERRPFSSKGTGAVEGAAPSLVSGRLGVGRMDIAHPIFRPRKHVAKETPHDLGGLIGSPSLDRDLDRD